MQSIDMFFQALRQLRQVSQDVSPPTVTGWGRRPAALRALSQRLSKQVILILRIVHCGAGRFHLKKNYVFLFHRGFNEAVNGFTDEGWSMIESDGIDDITILVNSSPSKMMGADLPYSNGFPSMNNAVLCAKASMLVQVRYSLFAYHND